MGSEQLPLHNVGIYHNLPTFSPSLTGLSAIVTGANGISGFHTLRVLLETPQRWSKVYALSRSPPPKAMLALLTDDQQSRVQHVAVDFLSPPDEITKAMKDAGVEAQYVFFYSYLQPKMKETENAMAAWGELAEELLRVNKSLLANFLTALEKAGIQPKRCVLQTGAKNYGIHIGRHRTPALESDPLLKHLEPNFYHAQYDVLEEYCQKNGVEWNVICPSWIVGSTSSGQISALNPFAVYAAVQAAKGESLYFPSDWNIWQDEPHHSSARLTGYLTEWVALEEKCKNEKFNAQDTSPLSWDRFFEELARWFGVKGVVGPEEDETKYKVVKGKSGKDTPMGYGPPTIYKTTFSFVDWAKEEDNQKVWKEIREKSDGQLTSDPFEDPVGHFQFADAIFQKMAEMNMSKARRLGWTGYVDTVESIFEMYKENGDMGLVPRMVLSEPRPMI